MSESSLWEWLRDVALPLGSYSRIETGGTSPGFPDVHCQIHEVPSFTIELKFSHTPESPIPFTSKSGMRRSQKVWIRENLRAGGTVWIIAEVTPHIYIFEGHLADQINGASQDKLSSMSRETIFKDAPEEAAQILHQLFLGE